jgi:hypothetical protein
MEGTISGITGEEDAFPLFDLAGWSAKDYNEVS